MAEPTAPNRRRALASCAGALVVAGCASPPPGRATEAARRAGGSPGAPAVQVARAAPADDAAALHLLNRFGYGPRPGDLERVRRLGADAWLEAQLAPGADASAGLGRALAALPPPAANHTGALAEFARLQATVLRAGTADDEREAATRALRELVVRVQAEARAARLLRALHGERQLEESLVEFWFNHFNVFAGKETVRATVGFYEREAIRPFVLGRFRDLLGATARHPAMLNYLDNWQSVATGFRAPPALVAAAGGFVLPRGPNENYARELLELHTLGVDGGYTQADVSELARVLTGWSFDRRTPGPEHAFRFYAARHDRGSKVVLGRAIPAGGVDEGEAVLDLLATHPATARHVARRLAVAYVADDPPASLVSRLADRFERTDGDLREVVRALATSDEFADPAVRGAKFKTPYQFCVSAVRAVGAPVTDVRPIAVAVARMGMPIYGCPTPDGWKDTRGAWLNAETLRQRIGFAVAVASRAGAGTAAGAGENGLPDPLAAMLGADARAAIDPMPPVERLAAALASPDFMRR